MGKTVGGPTNRLFDFVIVVAIVASAGVIGWRYFGSSKINPVVADHTVGRDVIALQGVNQGSGVLERDLRTARWRAVGGSARALFAANGLQPLMETPICKSPGQRPMEAIVAERADIVEAVAAKNFDVYLGDRDSRCYKSGSKLRVVVFDRMVANGAFARFAGWITIRQLYFGAVAKIPDLVFQALGIEKSEHAKFFGGADPETVFIFDSYIPDDGSQAALPLLPRAEKVPYSSLDAIRSRHKDVVVVDLRSAREAEASPVPGAHSLPVELDPMIANKSFFQVQRQELLNGAKYNSAHLLSLLREKSESTALVLIGANEEDLRPAPVAMELLPIRLANLYWMPLKYEK
jgi:hypothetical protein